VVRRKGRKVAIGLGLAAALVLAGGVILALGSLTPYTIYGPDDAAEHVVLRSRVRIPRVFPLLSRLRMMAAAVSGEVFRCLPVEVLRIEDREGKKVAVVDLRETPRNQEILDARRRLWEQGRGAEADRLLGGLEGTTWMTGYFQGSSGGAMTQGSLETTFLQPDAEGAWIDGVLFLHEGEAMEEMDHVDLEEVLWREDLQARLGGRR